MNRLLLVFGILGLVGCEAGEQGILTVEFVLAPVAPADLPDDMEPEALVVLPLAGGRVHADPFDGEGMVMAEGLPALPAGFEYVSAIGLADDALESLEEEEPELTWVDTGALDDDGNIWFFADDVGDLGALRAATVSIAPTEDGDFEEQTVLSGEAEIIEEESTGGGHVHGA